MTYKVSVKLKASFYKIPKIDKVLARVIKIFFNGEGTNNHY
jgi:hypothetical protein